MIEAKPASWGGYSNSILEDTLEILQQASKLPLYTNRIMCEKPKYDLRC